MDLVFIHVIYEKKRVIMLKKKRYKSEVAIDCKQWPCEKKSYFFIIYKV